MPEPQLPFDVGIEVAFVELAMRARGFQPDSDTLALVRRMFKGELTRDQARAEVFRKYEREPQHDHAHQPPR